MSYKKLIIFQLFFLISSNFLFSSQDIEITPYKFTDLEYKHPLKPYHIPASSKFLVKRTGVKTPNIIFYLTKPQAATYPIAIVCGPSMSREGIESIIHFHRYFLKEFLDLNVGVVSIEQWGIDNNHICKKEFLDHDTRTQRLKDHRDVIEHLKKHPPLGWNKKIIFLGAFEGGFLVTLLTCEYSDITQATINFCNASDLSWREELWTFLQKSGTHIYNELQRYKSIKPRELYDFIMDKTIQEPTSDFDFGGFTYLYHADAQSYPNYDYRKLKTPFLVVTGDQDVIVSLSDNFVKKARQAGVPITYYRIANMDQYIRERPDVIEQSFTWLKSVLNENL